MAKSRIGLIFVVLLIYSHFSSPFGAAVAPEIGNPAPVLAVKEWVGNGPQTKDPLSGKTIILEFWATWCNPCRDFIPHLNTWVEKYNSPKVIFISLTSEDRKAVEHFLKRIPIKGKVGLDINGAITRSFGVKGIPWMFLISPDGILRWSGHPVFLGDAGIDHFLRTGLTPPGLTPAAPADQKAPPQNQKEKETPPPPSGALSLSIAHHPPSPDDTTLSRMDITNGYFNIELKNQSLSRLLGNLVRLPECQIKIEGPSVDVFDVRTSIKVPDDWPKTLDTTLSQPDVNYYLRNAASAACRTVGYQLLFERRRVKGYRLRAGGPPPLESPMEKGWIGKNDGIIRSTAQPLAPVIEELETILEAPIIDESGFSGKYDLDIPASSFDKANSALEKYHLRLEADTVEVEFAVARPLSIK